MASKEEYGVDSIELKLGAKGVRARAGMYVGELDRRGVTHLFFEVFGNSGDEATNGYGKVIRCWFGKDGTVIVGDEGRGIPVGLHPKDKERRDTLTILCTEMHTGGKFEAGKENYKKGKIGTHGVGLGVVNALSESMEVWSWRNKTWNYQPFAAGEPQAPRPVTVKRLPQNLAIEQPNAGTVIRFKPDLTCFNKGAKFDPQLALEWLNEVSWLIGDVAIEVTVEGQKTKILHRPNGLQDRFDFECQRLGVEPLHEPFIYHSDQLDCLIGWTDGADETCFSSVSAIRTREGGTHVKGLESAISDSFAAYADKRASYKNDTLRTGMVAIVNIRMDEPSFNSQDKVALKSPEAKEIVYGELYSDAEIAALWTWLGSRAQKPLRDAVYARAEEITKLSEGFKASKKLAAAYKTEGRGRISLPKYLVRSLEDNPKERELYIVEGGSAGGTGKKARFAEFQEVWPLSGKILNVEKGNVESHLYSDRIIETLQCIGWNPANPGQYRVGKVILLTDADDDGSHIAALILTLLNKVTPDLVAAGRVFKCQAPLYMYRLNKGNVYGANLRELQGNVAAEAKIAFDPKKVTRIKGWGEINPDVLRHIAFDKASRKLTSVQPAVSAKEKQLVVDLMGENTAARKELFGV